MPRFRLPARGLLAGLAVLLIFSGCDHVTTPDGPNLINRFGDFTPLDPVSASASEVDFASGGTVTFGGSFNKEVNWVLEIVGQESGAVRRIESRSSELDETNAVWEGGTTDLPLFKDEAVEARLFVPEENSDTSRVALTVTTPRVYPGNVVEDFESGANIALTNPEFEFDQVGLSTTFDPPLGIPAAEGDSFYLLRGTDDVVANNFFIGLIAITPPGGGTFDVPTTIAEDLYFNAFLYNFGTPNTIPVVEAVIDANGNGTFDDGTDTIVPLGGDVEFPNLTGGFTGDGWQLYSEAANSFGAFGNGLTDAQTQQIVAIRVVLISDANAQPNPPLQVDYGIDYITFTAGGPLEL